MDLKFKFLSLILQVADLLGWSIFPHCIVKTFCYPAICRKYQFVNQNEWLNKTNHVVREKLVGGSSMIRFPRVIAVSEWDVSGIEN